MKDWIQLTTQYIDYLILSQLLSLSGIIHWKEYLSFVKIKNAKSLFHIDYFQIPPTVRLPSYIVYFIHSLFFFFFLSDMTAVGDTRLSREGFVVFLLILIIMTDGWQERAQHGGWVKNVIIFFFFCNMFAFIAVISFSFQYSWDILLINECPTVRPSDSPLE